MSVNSRFTELSRFFRLSPGCMLYVHVDITHCLPLLHEKRLTVRVHRLRRRPTAFKRREPIMCSSTWALWFWRSEFAQNEMGQPQMENATCINEPIFAFVSSALACQHYSERNLPKKTMIILCTKVRATVRQTKISEPNWTEMSLAEEIEIALNACSVTRLQIIAKLWRPSNWKTFMFFFAVSLFSPA